MNKLLLFFFISLIVMACSDDAELKEKQHKHLVDSTRRADSIEKYSLLNNNIKLAKLDSMLDDSITNAQYNMYDSLRTLDSLKAKRKKHEPTQPAPKKLLDKRLLPKN